MRKKTYLCVRMIISAEARGLMSAGMIKVKVPNDLLIEYKKATNLSVRKMAAITGLNKDRLSKILREGRR